MTETTYNFRKITAKDMTAITVILNKIGFAEIKPLITSTINEFNRKKEKDKKDKKEKEDMQMALGISIGLDVGSIILANYEKCADTLIEWLADVAGMEKKAVETLSLADFTELLFAVIQTEDFKDFFSVVSKLFK